MRTRSLLTLFLISGCAMAQGFGITLGLSVAKPRSIEDTTFSSQAGAYLGASYRWKEFTLGAAYRTPGKSSITYAGLESKDEFKWSYSEVSAQYGLAFPTAGATHRILLGVASRFESIKAEDTVLNFSNSASNTRIWGRLGYEAEAEVDKVLTSFGLFYSATAKKAFDPAKDYTPAEALRLFSPTSEFLVVLTFRF